jgi:thiamine biosynthesis lipoprotein
MIHVFRTMGTVVSLEFARPPATAAVATDAVRAVEAVFDQADRTFSLYRSDSPLSRIARGELRLPDAGATVLDAYSQAIEWRRLTDGAFSPHRPDGVLDLSGIVKALAMDAAAAALHAAGLTDWCLNAGGDVLTAGSALSPMPDDAELGRPVAWRIGIVDPAHRDVLVTSVALRAERPAVATSGSAERGEHIWRTVDHGDTGFVQVSVVAPDIITADVLATAIISGGTESRDDLTERWPIDVLTIDAGGQMSMTPGFVASMRASVA